MNPVLSYYIGALEARLIESPAIVSYQILRQEISSVDGKWRTRATTSDGGQAEFFLYLAEIDGQVQLLRYSFHWQDPRGQLRRRWDNAPHCPDLANAPHHVHEADGQVRAADDLPDFSRMMDDMELELGNL